MADDEEVAGGSGSEMINFGVSEKKAEELRGRMRACGVREADLVESFVRSSGAGGQKVNKAATCVCLKHEPSGLAVKMQKARSQGLNRFYARRRLCELIEARTLGREAPEAQAKAKRHKQKQRRHRRRQQRTSGGTGRL